MISIYMKALEWKITMVTSKGNLLLQQQDKSIQVRTIDKTRCKIGHRLASNVLMLLSSNVIQRMNTESVHQKYNGLLLRRLINLTTGTLGRQLDANPVNSNKWIRCRWETTLLLLQPSSAFQGCALRITETDSHILFQRPVSSMRIFQPSMVQQVLLYMVWIVGRQLNLTQLTRQIAKVTPLKRLGPQWSRHVVVPEAVRHHHLHMQEVQSTMCQRLQHYNHKEDTNCLKIIIKFKAAATVMSQVCCKESLRD